MAPDNKLELSQHVPWSEPAWYSSLRSPYYNESHRRLRDNIRKYIDENVLPYSFEWEEKGEAPVEASKAWLKSGIGLDDIPVQYRPASVPNLSGLPPGQLDAFHMLIIADETSRIEGGVGIALGGASSIGAPPVIHFGTEEQKSKWLPGLFTKETSFCLGITEPSGGSDVAQLRTTAEKTPDGKFYIVNGVKKWITGSPWASHMTTAVRTGGEGPKGISVLVIPMNLEGITVDKIQNSGQNAGGASFVDLDNVKVPVENLIGKENEGFSIIMRNFNRERFLLAVQCNRKSRTCLALAFQYAMQRETFGKPLMQYQVIRRKLTEVAHRVEAHWAWMEQLAYHIGTSPEGWQSPDVAGRLALLKVQGGQMVELAAREAQQIFGGAGYQRSGPGATVEQISRDLRMLVVGGGSEEIMADLALRQELMMAKAKLKLCDVSFYFKPCSPATPRFPRIGRRGPKFSRLGPLTTSRMQKLYKRPSYRGASLANVQTETNTLTSAVEAFSGDIQPRVTESNKFVGIINAGTNTVHGTSNLSVGDAIKIHNPVQTLQNHVQTLEDQLKDQVSAIQSANGCATTRDQLSKIAAATQPLIDAIVSNVPSNVQSTALSQGDHITAIIQDAEAAYAVDKCSDA